MAKHLRYFTEFVSIEGHSIRAEILQESDEVFIPVELGVGSGDSPLTIDWAETNKIEPVQGAVATLIVNSSSDRQLLHLAGILHTGDARLDIYRDGTLWWSGTFDSEPYEEPYRSKDNYDVMLSFSDFGPLNRLRWSRHGYESFSDILSACLNDSGINYNVLDSHVSTKLADGSSINMGELILDNDNFYDEDGDAKTSFEVLESILQPFALRIIQRSGKILLYDINAAAASETIDVEWKGDDATLSHDEVYNNATVRFSPYAKETILDGKVTVTNKTGNGVLVKTSYDTPENTVDGFVIHIHPTVTAHGAYLFNAATFFDLESRYSGSDSSGIIWSFMQGDSALKNGQCHQRRNDPGSCFAEGGTNVFVGNKIATFPLSHINSDQSVFGKYRLRINLDLLFDTRYNPFEPADKYNEKDNYEKMVNNCGFVWVPAMVVLRDAQGNARYHLENQEIAMGNGYSQAGPKWVAGEGQPGCFFLAYYDHSDRRSKCGVGGWSTNRRCIGYYTGDLPASWAKMDAGEYAMLPPESGNLEFSLYSGFHIRNKNIVSSVYDILRWVAYKDARITLVQKNGLDIELSDQEDKAYINRLAQEDISVDTILGTPSGALPAVSGRGFIFFGTGIHTKFCRANTRDRLEKLLLGTIYSQYAERKAKLSGTVGLLSGIVMGDSPRMADKRFLLAADRQNLYLEESVMVMTEFESDNYRDIAYE